MMTTSNAVVVDSMPAGDACFHRFSDLPSELQCYTLSFLPARVLVRDVARTSRRMKCIIDAYVQRRINAALGVSANKTAKGKDKFEDEPCTLMFEAQRPIDTLTSRHRLYYSHMEYAGDDEQDDRVSTLQAHFAFVHAHDADMNASITSNNTDSHVAQPNAHDAYDGPSGYVQGRRGRRRTNTRTGARPWATWSEPVTSSLAALERGRRAAANVSSSIDDLRSTSREASSRDASLARREAHYGPTIAAAGASAQRPPTYRFQLDALDSFETWILSLTVQRLWWQSLPSSKHTVAPRPMRWEKRVVEGLDRIFRDWFKPAADNPPSIERQTCSGHASTVITAIPDERELELDGQGCILRIQPHLNEHAETHPALVSMSSHYYLSNAIGSPYSAATNAALTAASQNPSYVDFTFHCTGLRLNAGRLLSVIEDIDLHVARTRKQISAVSEADVSVETTTQDRSSSHLNGLSSAGFIVMGGSTSNGVSWSQAR